MRRMFWKLRLRKANRTIPSSPKRWTMTVSEALAILVAQIEFAEWTPDGHLRHSKFVGLREDKDSRRVVHEDPAQAQSNSKAFKD